MSETLAELLGMTDGELCELQERADSEGWEADTATNEDEQN